MKIVFNPEEINTIAVVKNISSFLLKIAISVAGIYHYIMVANNEPISNNFNVALLFMMAHMCLIALAINYLFKLPQRLGKGKAWRAGRAKPLQKT